MPALQALHFPLGLVQGLQRHGDALTHLLVPGLVETAHEPSNPCHRTPHHAQIADGRADCRQQPRSPAHHQPGTRLVRGHQTDKHHERGQERQRAQPPPATAREGSPQSQRIVPRAPQLLGQDLGSLTFVVDA